MSLSIIQPKLEEEKYAQTSSGIIVPYYIIKKRKRPIAFDFFCGAGGMGCGFIQAGFEIVGANEFDPFASITYMVNLGHYPMKIHYIGGEEDKKKLDKAVVSCWRLKRSDYNGNKITPAALNKAFGDEILAQKPCVAGSGWIKRTGCPGVKNFWFGDIHKLKGKDILEALGLKQGDLDAVCGGPPCQGFSKAGKQAIDDPRNTLIYEYARLIVELQPKTFVMEEVPDVVNFFDPDGVPVLNKFCLMLQEGGYGKWEMIKKSMLMQTGAAAGIKGMTKGNAKIDKTKRAEPCKKKKASDSQQMSLFT